MAGKVFDTLRLNGNFAGNYKVATILTIRPDQPRQMTAEQLRAFKTLLTWSVSDKWLRLVAWNADSRKLAIYEFPNEHQLWVLENRRFWSNRVVLLAMPPLPKQSSIVHGLGCWTVAKRDYDKVFAYPE